MLSAYLDVDDDDDIYYPLAKIMELAYLENVY